MSTDELPPVAGRDPRWFIVGVSPEQDRLVLPVDDRSGSSSGIRMVEALGSDGRFSEAVVATAQRHLVQGETVPGLDPIALWAATATTSDLREQLREPLGGLVDTLALPGENTGLVYQPDSPRPGCAAWHDDGFAVVEVPAGLSHVVVSYQESGTAALSRTVALHALTRGRRDGIEQPPPETFDTGIEWFCFGGDNTVSLHGNDLTTSPLSARGTGTVPIETGGRHCALLLRPWQWLGSRLDPPRSDPMFQTRLATHLGAHRDADHYPEVADVPDQSLPNALVWVHGTVSCGLPGAIELANLLDRAVYRYEHDTFRDIEENGRDLADLLKDKLTSEAGRLVLVGHSRGGLVARVAATVIKQRRKDLDLTVLTLGTPHRGTPIVNLGERALRALVAATTFGLRAVPDPASMLLKYLVRYARVPSGIGDMAADGPWIRGLNAGPEPPYPIISIGADYTAGARPESSGVKALGRLRPLFEAAGTPENDLVVALASATAVGTRVPLDKSCGHFQYLQDPDVRGRLRKLAPGLSHVAQKQAGLRRIARRIRPRPD
ncbi:hypothetical protein [Intrasporangium sp.]|uniref:esterase/lipase family protein n=1 Tax=Intrasporangium sp. TaxID=1925024 RepID=UPI003221EF69